MELNNLLILAGTQLALILVFTVVGLGIYTLKLRRQLRDDKSENEENASAQPAEHNSESDTADIERFLENELDKTKQLFQMFANSEQNPEIEPNMSPKLMAMTIRYKYLDTERNAIQASQQLKDYWENIETPLIELLNSLKPAEPNTATQDSKKEQGQVNVLEQALAQAQAKVAELKEFKQLITDLQHKWENAKPIQNAMHQQLTSVGQGLDNKDEYQALLDKYHETFSLFSELLGDEDITAVTPPQQSEKNCSQEMQNLHSIALEQSKTISNLRAELENLKNAPGLDVGMVNMYESEIDNLESMMQEFQTCIKTLESELDASHHTVKDLLQRLEEAETGDSKQDLLKTIEQFTRESEDIVNSMNMLSDENEVLRKKLAAYESDPEAPIANSDANDNGDMRNELANKEQQLADLQTQYNELEQKYLTLVEQSIGD